MKFCVIGLGRFGYQVATTLAENGMEVLGVDSHESIVSSIRDYITHAVTLQVNDEVSLRSIGVDEMDTVIVAMGENFAGSILITALLKKKLHIPLVITRAVNEIHKEILMLIGADRVILPEQEIGAKLADNLSLPFSVLSRVTKRFSIAQITTPGSFVGKHLDDLNLYKQYRINCVGIKKEDEIMPVDPHYTIEEDDNLILAGNNKDLEALGKL
ncbi:MAG: TrkA family potassium uptake protein [Candidatus Babeliales bacterium]